MKVFYLTLPLLMIFDSFLAVSILGSQWPIMVSFIFIVFIFFKTDFIQSLSLLLVYFIFVKILSPMPFHAIALPYLIILLSVFSLKKRVLLETYFLYAVWMAILSFAFILLQTWFYYENDFLSFMRFSYLWKLIYYSLLQGALAFLLFIIFDKVFERFLIHKKDLYA